MVTPQIVFLVLSAGVYVGSFFSLYSVFQVSHLDPFTAAGIGAIVTFTLVLSFLALYSGRGVVTECALLVGVMFDCCFNLQLVQWANFMANMELTSINVLYTTLPCDCTAWIPHLLPLYDWLGVTSNSSGSATRNPHRAVSTTSYHWCQKVSSKFSRTWNSLAIFTLAAA